MFDKRKCFAGVGQSEALGENWGSGKVPGRFQIKIWEGSGGFQVPEKVQQVAGKFQRVRVRSERRLVGSLEVLRKVP